MNKEADLKIALCETLGFDSHQVQSLNLVVEPTQPVYAVVRVLVGNNQVEQVVKHLSYITRDECHMED